MKTAVVIGASGLVGSEILRQLLTNTSYDLVKSVSRKSLAVQHSKLEQHILSLDQLATIADKLKGDDYFFFNNSDA